MFLDPRNHGVVLAARQAVVDGSAECIAHIAHCVDFRLGRRATVRRWIIVLWFLAHVVDGRCSELHIDALLRLGQIPPCNDLVVSHACGSV